MKKRRIKNIIGWIILGGAVALSLTSLRSLLSLRGKELIAAVSIAVFILMSDLLTNTLTSKLASLSFLPALIGMLILGVEAGSLVAILGFIVGDIAFYLQRLIFNPETRHRSDRSPSHHAAVQGGRVLILYVFMLASNFIPGLSLPLSDTSIRSLAFLLAFTVTAVVLDEAWLLLLRLYFTPDDYSPFNRSNLILRIIAAFFAASAALLYAVLGLNALLFAEIIMALSILAYMDLIREKDVLHNQLERLKLVGQFDRTIKPSLTVDSILEYYFVQVNAISDLKNMMIILTGTGEISAGLRVEYALVNGRKVAFDSIPVDGLFQYVLATKKALFADPIESLDETFRDFILPANTERWMGLPLLAADEMIGMAIFWSPPSLTPVKHLQEPDRELVQIITSQTGTELENAILYESTNQYIRQMGLLNQISEMITVSMNPEEILEVVVEAIEGVLTCDRTAIYLMSHKDEEASLVLARHKGFPQDEIGEIRDIDQMLSLQDKDRVLYEGERIFIANAERDSMMIPEKMRAFLNYAGLSAYAAFPMRDPDGPIGILVTFYDKPHDFKNREIEMLDTFTNQAVLAVTNSRIYQKVDIELNRRVGQIMRMYGVSQELNSTLDQSALFRTIVHSSVEETDGDFGILLIDSGKQGDDKRTFQVVASSGLNPYGDDRITPLADYVVKSGVINSGDSIFTNIEWGELAGSGLFAPIILDKRVSGVIAINSANRDQFNKDDLRFVRQLASQAGLALKNADLFNDTRLVRDRLESILNSSDDGLIMLDLNGNVVKANDRMGTFWELMTPDWDQEEETLEISLLKDGGETLGFEPGEIINLIEDGRRGDPVSTEPVIFTLGDEDAPIHYLEKSIMPVLDDEGQFIGLLIIMRDVTGAKSLEEARQRLTELIVHDLRAPLQAVMSSLKLIETASDPACGPVEQGLEMSGLAVQKMLRMVDTMLDLSKMERGEIDLDRNFEALMPIIEDSIVQLQPLIDEDDVNIEIAVPDDLPFLDVDADILSRVFVNLIDNALKYGPMGGMIEINAKQADGSIRINIQDQGPGIPDEYKEAIWERFSMIPGRKAQRSSAGLGLNFCRLAIESHGGDIWVENREGGGSCFCINLPVTDFEEFEASEYDG